MNLETSLMGIKLKNPIIIGSSSLTDSASNVKKISKAGAGAVVLKSLYEEQILVETKQKIAKTEMYQSYPEAMDYIHTYAGKEGVEKYLQLIRECKESTEIPVIASINCFSLNKWIYFSKEIEDAGADAIELNISIFPEDDHTESAEIENEYYKIVASLKDIVSIPIAVKMNAYFTNIRMVAKKTEEAGASALVLFNRFYRPDIDIDYLQMITRDTLSGPGEITQSLRWVGLLSKKLKCDLVASTGIHDAAGVIKQILAGANSVQICSILYENGIDFIGEILGEINAWMHRKGFKSIDDFRGLINKDAHNTQSWERIHFMKKTSGNIIKPVNY